MKAVLLTILNVYSFILLARVIVSWIAVGGNNPNIRHNPIVEAIYQLTEPPVQLVRQFMPKTGMMDFSVLVVFLLISLLQRVVISLPIP